MPAPSLTVPRVSTASAWPPERRRISNAAQPLTHENDGYGRWFQHWTNDASSPWRFRSRCRKPSGEGPPARQVMIRVGCGRLKPCRNRKTAGRCHTVMPVGGLPEDCHGVAEDQAPETLGAGQQRSSMGPATVGSAGTEICRSRCRKRELAALRARKGRLATRELRAQNPATPNRPVSASRWPSETRITQGHARVAQVTINQSTNH